MVNDIVIIGLGAGDLDQLPYGIYKKLKGASSCFVRTMEHPVINELMNEGVSFISFDDVYEKHDTFEKVYEEIAETLLKQASVEVGTLCCARPSNGCRKNGTDSY